MSTLGRSISSKVLLSLLLAAFLWYNRHIFPANTLHNSASAFAGISATLLGFMIASLSILTALINQRLLRNLQRTGHYKILLNELYYTAASFAAVTVLALFNIFLVEPYVTVGMIATIAVMTFATLMMVSVGQKFWKLLSNINPES